MIWWKKRLDHIRYYRRRCMPAKRIYARFSNEYSNIYSSDAQIEINGVKYPPDGSSYNRGRIIEKRIKHAKPLKVYIRGSVYIYLNGSRLSSDSLETVGSYKVFALYPMADITITYEYQESSYEPGGAVVGPITTISYIINIQTDIVDTGT